MNKRKIKQCRYHYYDRSTFLEGVWNLAIFFTGVIPFCWLQHLRSIFTIFLFACAKTAMAERSNDGGRAQWRMRGFPREFSVYIHYYYCYLYLIPLIIKHRLSKIKCLPIKYDKSTKI